MLFQLAKPILVADDESHGRVVVLDKVVQIEWLSEDEQSATEGVAHFLEHPRQLGFRKWFIFSELSK